MEKPIIETKGLTVYCGRQRGITDVDLQVQPGEVFGFLGPNGAGKTTTVRVLLDVIRATRGECAIFGLDCHRDGVQIRRRVGYLPGELRLPEHMTALCCWVSTPSLWVRRRWAERTTAACSNSG